MGVYIKGMEMPTSCYFCEMYEADMYWCSAAKRDIDSFDDYDNRSSFCPLVPVPKHGDLIDRDELMKHKGNCYDADGHLLYAVGTGSIMCAPTIIPANKEG